MPVHRYSGPEAAEEFGNSSILDPSGNVWRGEHARRARMLVDAAEYFGVLRASMLQARRSLIVVGWDIDSRMRFVGPGGEADDGYPELFGDFLKRLAREKPGLEIKLLLWDYSVIYATERQLLPALPLRWNTPSNIDFCLDNQVPFGGSHHQKIVVIDDSLAFSGGIDLTVRRWDTSAHDPENSRRVDQARRPYRPFHDVQMMVDGDAAAALGELTRWRWRIAACEDIEPVETGGGDPWPQGVEPHFRDIRVGIARTLPSANGDKEIREVARLFVDSIARAERWIYIENQFLTCLDVARALAARLREVPHLEVLLVAPQTHVSWLEQQSMLAGRVRFMDVLREAGMEHRVRLLYPSVGEGNAETGIMVHSKVMIVDDRLLPVGSANICNRSMGVDTECDLVIEADDVRSRSAVLRSLARLVGEHCGVTTDEALASIRETGSVFDAVERCGRRADRRLRPVEDGETGAGASLATVEAIADPGRPIAADEYLADIVDFPGEGRRSRVPAIARGAALLLFVAALGLLWRYTPLSEYARPDTLRTTFGSLADSPFAAAIIVVLYIVTGFLALPVTVLIIVTAGTFGLWPGLLYAAVVSMSSAVATYGAGRGLGARFLRNTIGPRINRVSRGIGERGVLAVATIRLVPVAPFMLVNLVAGALRIPFLEYAVGTFLGLAPGILLLSVLGDRVFAMLENPSLFDLAVALGALLLWIVFALALQRLANRWRKRGR